ncbi:hypothetical protein KC367_g279 [Hortaea werneckii]|nr:hypothetical protein KC367_g279 [Hortaea werneckii]
MSPSEGTTTPLGTSFMQQPTCLNLRASSFRCTTVVTGAWLGRALSALAVVGFEVDDDRVAGLAALSIWAQQSLCFQSVLTAVSSLGRLNAPVQPLWPVSLGLAFSAFSLVAFEVRASDRATFAWSSLAVRLALAAFASFVVSELRRSASFAVLTSSCAFAREAFRLMTCFVASSHLGFAATLVRSSSASRSATVVSRSMIRPLASFSCFAYFSTSWREYEAREQAWKKEERRKGNNHVFRTPTLLLSPLRPLPLMVYVSYTRAGSSDQLSETPQRYPWILPELAFSYLAPNRLGLHIRQHPSCPSPSSFSSAPLADWAKPTSSSRTSGS